MDPPSRPWLCSRLTSRQLLLNSHTRLPPTGRVCPLNFNEENRNGGLDRTAPLAHRQVCVGRALTSQPTPRPTSLPNLMKKPNHQRRSFCRDEPTQRFGGLCALLGGFFLSLGIPRFYHQSDNDTGPTTHRTSVDRRSL